MDALGVFYPPPGAKTPQILLSQIDVNLNKSIRFVYFFFNNLLFVEIIAMMKAAGNPEISFLKQFSFPLLTHQPSNHSRFLESKNANFQAGEKTYPTPALPPTPPLKWGGGF